MRRDSWLPLMNDDDHVNVLIPIMALAYEHHPDPVMRPYKEPFSIERREKLIVGVAASVRRSTATFPGAENLKLKSSHLLEPFDAMPRNLAATSHVHADQVRSSSTAVPTQRFIDVCLAARPRATCPVSKTSPAPRPELTYPKPARRTLGPRRNRLDRPSIGRACQPRQRRRTRQAFGHGMASRGPPAPALFCCN